MRFESLSELDEKSLQNSFSSDTTGSKNTEELNNDLVTNHRQVYVWYPGAIVEVYYVCM